jgi:NAD+--asparagine ADP-ribosyltransferase
MNEIKIEEYENFVSTFLKNYLENGMGTMSKREIDILVMHLLTKYSDIGEKSNYDLSIFLQLSESRIKSLRYEAKLKYPPDEKKYVEKEFLTVLARSQFDTDKKKIIFVIEDTYLRHAINGRLKAKGMFADTSFNSELVKVDVTSLETIIREMYGNDVGDKYKEALNTLLEKEKKDEQELSFKKLKNDFITSAVKSLGGTLGGAAGATFLAYLKTLF